MSTGQGHAARFKWKTSELHFPLQTARRGPLAGRWRTPWLTDKITLIALPPYSPELNPVENVWEYLRKNKLAKRLYEAYE
jgi:transposase